MKDINKRITEVEYILNKLETKYKDKIPNEIWKYIEENKDKDYIYNYDDKKELKENNLHVDTIAILTYLNMEYLLDENEKIYIKKMLDRDDIIAEEEKRKKYNPKDIFKSNQNNLNTKNTEKHERLELVEYNEKKWYQKLFAKILKLFRKN